MHKPTPEVDIILSVLTASLRAKPESVFINSLYNQYCERGGLSKKQLEGLHSKASKIEGIAPGKLATLQAIILKKPTRYKSTITTVIPEPVKEDISGTLIQAILEKAPQHKRVLFLKAKQDNREQLTETDIAELQRFKKLLVDRS